MVRTSLLHISEIMPDLSISSTFKLRTSHYKKPKNESQVYIFIWVVILNLFISLY
jgi:hypothetical protein